LNGSYEFIHWELFSLEVLIDSLEEGLGHVGFSVENPEIFVGGVADGDIGVVLVEPDDPVVGGDI